MSLDQTHRIEYRMHLDRTHWMNLDRTHRKEHRMSLDQTHKTEHRMSGLNAQKSLERTHSSCGFLLWFCLDREKDKEGETKPAEVFRQQLVPLLRVAVLNPAMQRSDLTCRVLQFLFLHTFFKVFKATRDIPHVCMLWCMEWFCPVYAGHRSC